MKEQFDTILKNLSQTYPDKGYDKILYYNVNEFSIEQNKRAVLNEDDIYMSLSTRIKTGIRNTLHFSKSFKALKKLQLKNPIIIMVSNNLQMREVLPLYKELILNKLSCFLLSSKYHIYKKLQATCNILFLPNKMLTKNNFKLNGKLSGTLAETLIGRYYKRNKDWLKKTHKIINSFNPKAIITLNDLLPEERIFNEVANLKSIVTINMQHGTINKSELFSYSNAKYWLVYGLHTKEILSSLGINEANIFVTGTSYLEKYIHQSTSTDKTTYKENELLVDGKPSFLILFSGKGHSTSQENYEQQLQAAKQLIQENPAQDFIIKLHPKEEINAYKDFKFNNCKVIGHLEFVEKQYNLLSLLSLSQGIITGISASIFEAMAMDKIVFTVDCLQEYGSYAIIENSITVHATHADELVQKFSKLENKPQYYNGVKEKAANFAQKYFDKGEKPSVARQVEIIQRLVA